MSEKASGGTGLPSALLSGQALPVSWDHGRDAHATHGQDAHATATPTGVTGNLSPAQGSLFKTNPISASVGAWQAPGSTGTTDDLSRNETRKTKPICTGTGETAVFEAEKGRSASAQDDSEETKPISWDDSSALPAVRRVA